MRKTVLACFLILCLCAFSACTEMPQPSASTAEPTATSTPTAEATPATPEITGKTVSPIESTINIDQIDNSTFAAGFKASDVSLDGGALMVKFTVYDYERFDIVDVTHLAPGDTLVIDGEELTVVSVEKDEYGRISINDGYGEGNCCLMAEENGSYFEIGENDAKKYYALGEVALPVAQEFVLNDNADLDNPNKTLLGSNFIMEMENSDDVFTPFSTTITVTNGKITDITRHFVP